MRIRQLKHLAAASLLLFAPNLAISATSPDPIHDEKSATALRLRAEKGDGNAALELGNLLSRDRVPAAKFGKAADWYRRGCDLDDLAACHNAGYSYEAGRNGVAKDVVEAATYYLKAAEHAFLPSMINLGALYANGLIISTDGIEGYKWLLIARLAANQCAGVPMCLSVIEDRKGHRKKMKSLLTENEQRAAEKMALDWKPK